MKLVIAILIALGSLAVTATSGLAQIPFTKNCPSGRVLIGLKGWQGWWMDGVQGVCGKISSQGRIVSNDVSYTTRAGGTGGSGTSRSTHLCPSGQVMTGFRGTRALYVNTIRTLTCQPLDPDNRRAIDPRSSRTAFASKDGSRTSETCSGGRVATGFSGNAGIYLGSFDLTCGWAPGPSSTSSGSSRPTKTRRVYRLPQD